MKTLTIEIPDDAAAEVETRARQANQSVSEWVRARIADGLPSPQPRERDAMGYPPAWFERMEGSLADVDDFCVPEDPPATAALAHGAILVTGNTHEFSRIPGLPLEDWSTPV